MTFEMCASWKLWLMKCITSVGLRLHRLHRSQQEGYCFDVDDLNGLAAWISQTCSRLESVGIKGITFRMWY